MSCHAWQLCVAASLLNCLCHHLQHLHAELPAANAVATSTEASAAPTISHPVKIMHTSASPAPTTALHPALHPAPAPSQLEGSSKWEGYLSLATAVAAATVLLSRALIAPCLL
jgi:hypothetical protein